MKIISLIILVVSSLNLSAQDIFPNTLKMVPVLIQIPLPNSPLAESGTGIYLSESNKIFFVTASHCIFNPSSANWSELWNSNAILSSYGYGGKKNVVTIDLGRLNNEGQIKHRMGHDVAVLLIGTETNPDTNGGVIFSFRDGVQAIPNPLFPTINLRVNENCILFDDILDGDETYIFGYPGELINPIIPSEIDFNFPLIRKGIISQRNLQTKKLIIDSGVYGGNSGGPIVIAKHLNTGQTLFNISGLMTEFVPVSTRMFPQGGVTNSIFANSGYSVAEPVDSAIELMRQF